MSRIKPLTRLAEPAAPRPPALAFTVKTKTHGPAGTLALHAAVYALFLILGKNRWNKYVTHITQKRSASPAVPRGGPLGRVYELYAYSCICLSGNEERTLTAKVQSSAFVNFEKKNFFSVCLFLPYRQELLWPLFSSLSNPFSPV